MFSLKKTSGTFKGLAGECMFHIGKRNTILTHFQPKKLAVRLISNKYTNQQIKFIEENWDTIDAIDTNEQKIYEIKTKSCDYGKYKTKVTASYHNTLKKAVKIGIKPILAKVILEEDWLFIIKETDYLAKDVEIVIPKKYNKPYERLNS